MTRGEHEQPADQAVEQELDRRVRPLRAAAEAADEEVHRDEHGLEEDVEQEDVGGGEDADHHRLEQQDQREVALDRGRSAPSASASCHAGEDHDGHEQRGHRDQHERDAVDADGVGTPKAVIQAWLSVNWKRSPPASNATAMTIVSTSTTSETPRATCLASSVAPRGQRGDHDAPTSGHRRRGRSARERHQHQIPHQQSAATRPRRRRTSTTRRSGRSRSAAGAAAPDSAADRGREAVDDAVDTRWSKKTRSG